MILSPEKPVSKIIAKIVKRNGDIYTRFTEKRDDFRKAIKSLGFHWNGCEWQKEINQYTGDADSRQVQTAHYLLSQGFIVEIDDSLVSRVVNADYMPECRRWIKRIVNEDTFTLHWPYEDNLYTNAMKIDGAYYKPSCVRVPSEFWKEVKGFAEIYGFQFSDGASDLMQKAEAKESQILIVSVKPKKIDGWKRPTLDAGNVTIPDELFDKD